MVKYVEATAEIPCHSSAYKRRRHKASIRQSPSRKFYAVIMLSLHEAELQRRLLDTHD